MTTYFALTTLVSRVRERFVFDAEAAEPVTTPVPVTFGWRAPSVQRSTTHRIVFVPGDDAGGALGSIGAPDSPYVALARPIARLDEVFTVYLEASDREAPEDEERQYLAARALFDAFVRAVHLARVPYSITSSRWVTERTLRSSGATLRLTGTVSAIVPDAPSAIAPSDTTATVAAEELDLTQTLTVSAS